MALLNPTINAYRRIVPDSLAPINISWGWDNRTAFVRIPAERGRATRVEIRIGDGSANPYLAIAAVLFAGLHGLRDELPLPDPVAGDAYTQEAGRLAVPAVASRARSTRWRPTSTCATRSATAIVHAVRRDEALRDRAPPQLGLRLGARRVPPPPVRESQR